MSSELDVLAASAPRTRVSPAQVYPPAERHELFKRITTLTPDETTKTVAPEDRTWIELVHPPMRRSHRRGRLLSAMAALTAAAAVAFGSLVLWSDGSGTQPGGIPSPVLPFKLKPSSGFKVLSVIEDGSAYGPDTATIVRRGQKYLADVYPAGARVYVNPAHSLRVNVDGQRGYYGCITSDPPRDWHECPDGPLAWHYATDAWVMLSGEGHAASATELEHVASALRFDEITQLRGPISLRSAPLNMVRYGYDVFYPIGKRSWGFGVQYSNEPAVDNDGIAVNLSPRTLTVRSKRGAPQAVTVDGHPGYWYANDGATLDVQVAEGIQLSVVAWTDATHLDLNMATAIVRTVQLASDPADPSTWFSLDGALP